MCYSEKEESGYSWLSFHPNRQWKLSLLVSVGILAISFGFFAWSTHVSDDMGGDSFAGLVFAVASTVFLFLAALALSLRRRAHKQAVGGLNAVLNWHVCFGVIALILVFLHAFGNVNPRTGTYALYGMIALVISGAIGRILDRLMPHRIAQEVDKVLTPQGEDRIETIVRELQARVIQKRQGRSASHSEARPAFANRSEPSARQKAFPSTWDMGYISLEKMPQQGRRLPGQSRVLSDWKREPASAGPLSLQGQVSLAALEEVQQAFKRERFFRSVIRSWRVFHITLAVVTVALTLWHIEYALSLIIPAFQKFGFGYLLPWP